MARPAITVQNVSVGDGGQRIVGNVTQHARVIVSDKNPASAARNAPKGSAPGEDAISADASGSTSMSDHIRNTGPMLASLRCWRQKPVPAARAARRRCTARSAAHARWCTGIRRTKVKPERAQARPVQQGCDRRAKGRFRCCLGEARKLLEEMK